MKRYRFFLVPLLISFFLTARTHSADSNMPPVPPPPVSESAVPAPPPVPDTSASDAKSATVPAPPAPVETSAQAQPPEKAPAAEAKPDSTLPAPTLTQIITAYKYAYALYSAKRFKEAGDIFKKLAILDTRPDVNANSLYYYSQCAFRTEDYNNCVKALEILAKKWPNSAAVRKGYVSQFSEFLIQQVSSLQTRWDYFRFKERTGPDGQPIWKESVPPGFKIKRINFKLGFGLYRVLNMIQPDTPQTSTAKKELETMLNSPITMLWVDEKAPPDRYGHPEDFLSIFSLNEKKDFSNVICKRMFFDWQSEKFYQFLDMHDDVRNLKPRFVAQTKQDDDGAAGDPTAVFTLSKLFRVSGYNPYSDSYTNILSPSPSNLNL
jgi:tetratricopeptide (TPR) repeat protein